MHHRIKVAPIKVDRTIAQLSTQSPTLVPVPPPAPTRERSSSVSSVSSIESDDKVYTHNGGECNIWDNSELRLRGINTNDFTDSKGKYLSFLQLFKLRSFFYSKSNVPAIGKIFKDAERIAKFCNTQFSLDEFLEDNKQAAPSNEPQKNLINIDFRQDRNYARFASHFDTILESNSRKCRETMYDRYALLTPSSQTYYQYESLGSPLRKPQLIQHSQSLSMSGLNLSPRKAPKSNTFALITDRLPQQQQQPQQYQQLNKKTQSKYTLNMLELNQLHKTQKMSQVGRNNIFQNLKKQESNEEEGYSPMYTREVVNFTPSSQSNLKNSQTLKIATMNKKIFASHENLKSVQRKSPLELTPLDIHSQSCMVPPLPSPNSASNLPQISNKTSVLGIQPASKTSEFRLKLLTTQQIETPTSDATSDSAGSNPRHSKQIETTPISHQSRFFAQKPIIWKSNQNTSNGSSPPIATTASMLKKTAYDSPLLKKTSFESPVTQKQPQQQSNMRHSATVFSFSQVNQQKIKKPSSMDSEDDDYQLKFPSIMQDASSQRNSVDTMTSSSSSSSLSKLQVHRLKQSTNQGPISPSQMTNSDGYSSDQLSKSSSPVADAKKWLKSNVPLQSSQFFFQHKQAQKVNVMKAEPRH